MKKLIIPLVMVVFVASACFLVGGDDVLADMEVRAQAGKVMILRADEVIEVGNENVTLELKDVVKTGANGLAALKLEDDRVVKMQPEAEILIQTTHSIESNRGSVLVVAPVETTVLLEETQAVASRGSFRIDQGFGTVRAGSYDTLLRLVNPGQNPLKVSPLHEATVAAGDLPGAAKPYRLDPKDPWDQDQLQEVIELEDELDLLAKGFSRQLGNDRPNLAYFSALADGHNVSFMRPYLKRRPVDLLIGFTVADNDRDLALKSSFKKAFSLYDQGATWGITAGILDVSARPIVAQLEDVILGTGVVAAGGEAEEPAFTVAAGQEGSEQGPSGPADEVVSDGGGKDEPGGGGGGGGDDEDPSGGDEDPPGDCDPTDVECIGRRVFSPSPSPSGVLDGVVGGGAGGGGSRESNAW